MQIGVDRTFIERVVKNWDDAETQGMIEAMVAELKKDCREAIRRNYSHREECEAFYEDLIGQVQNEDFWNQMDHLLHFGFEY